MKEQSTVSEIAERAICENAEAEAISFVIRIWKLEGAADADCRGWLEHVQSGQRKYFVGLGQLSSVIATYMGVLVRQRKQWRIDLIGQRVRGWLERCRKCLKGRN